ncbi:RNA polymerase sigma factor [Saccharicrinis sp. FJH62]|uniref:RNA polymerase sigma factor n=1 Tax=Saccharicrinis sp. FJH62 TaxID=3344657 RepID=UPI0035D4DB30
MKEQRLVKILHTKRGQQILFEQYYTSMYAVAVRYVKLREDAEDLLSEAFIRVIRYSDTFEFCEEGSLNKWIKTIVINEALRMLEKKKKIRICEEMYETDLEITADVEGSIDMDFFLGVVNTLPDGYRVVFLMYVVEEYTHKEIAEKLNISISTSKSQLFKARSFIVKKLKHLAKDEIIRNRKTV